MKTVIFIAKNTDLGGAELSMLQLMRHLETLGIRTGLVVEIPGTLHSQFKEVCSKIVTARLPYPRKIGSWRHIPNFLREISRLRLFLGGTATAVANDFYETFASALTAKIGFSQTLAIWQSSYNFDSTRDALKWKRYGFSLVGKALAAAPVAAHLNATHCLPNLVQPLNPYVDETVFDAQKFDRTELRKRLGWTRYLVGIVVGRIGESKGQLPLMRAFLENPSLNIPPDCRRLCIVGPANGRDQLELQRAVEIAPGKVEYAGSRSDIPALLAAADVALFPGTIPESFGLGIVEALLMEKPILALRNNGALTLHTGSTHLGLAESLEELLAKWLNTSTWDLQPSLRAEIIKKYGTQAYQSQVADIFLA